ncbi:MAG: ABC transporter substrate-binding protein [Rickettsiaceae bacterium]|nr:ABC transporter substrate-binding protein [Rickettsiaceae bacterium]
MKKILSLLLALGFFVISCSPGQKETKFAIATSADNPPFEFVENGKIVGFDIDLAAEIAKELKMELEITNLDFHSLIMSLLTDKVDVAIAALTPSPTRLAHADFSKPYTETEMAVLFRDDMKIDSEEDLKSKVLGAQFGTTWAEYAEKMAKASIGGSVRTLPDNLTLVKELLSKNVDILVMEKVQAMKFASKHGKLSFFVLPNTKSQFAIALAKNSKLTPRINEIITKLDKNGFLKRLKNKWLQ